MGLASSSSTAAARGTCSWSPRTWSNRGGSLPFLHRLPGRSGSRQPPFSRHLLSDRPSPIAFYLKVRSLVDWFNRVLQLPTKLVRLLDETEVIAAENIRRHDILDFGGAELRVEQVTYLGLLVEVEAVGPYGETQVHLAKQEAVRVFLPRAEVS